MHVCMKNAEGFQRRVAFVAVACVSEALFC